MTINKRMKSLVYISLLTVGMLLAACSPTAEKLNQQGNQAYLKEVYQEAYQAYRSAQIESPELAEPYYNAANSLYRQGKYAAALAQLEQALSFAGDRALAENSLFNSGNNYFNSQEWQAAIEAYKQALLLNPDDQDAKYNLELALQQLQSQGQQQEQQQQEKQEQQNPDQSENSQQDQKDQQAQTDSGENQQDQQNPDQAESGDNQGEADQSHDSQGSEGSQEQPQNPEDGQPQPGQEGQNGEYQPGKIPPAGQRMTEDQARQLLAAIANDMDTLQERLGEILFVRELPPLQDW